MSYGQVAAVIGSMNPRTVGWALANALDGDVPWQRVVGADGYLRIGRQSTALMALQRNLLEREGVSFLTNGCVDMGHHQWNLEELELSAIFPDSPTTAADRRAESGLG